MIKLVNISKFYHEGNVVTLGLRKVNLEFKMGEFVAITGESGSGKSTLLNVISGIDTYEDGEMYINGQETSYYDDDDWEKYRKNYIGFIFQNYNLIDSYTVLENVEAAMIVQGIQKKERIERAKKIIEKVGLTNHIKHKATKLSGGQKQRLAIARALAKNTKIIVADEPTGNLDSETGKQIMELLYEISKEKLVLMVTHNYEEAESYVTRKIKLFDGEVVEDREIKDFEEKEVVLEENIKDSSFKKAISFSLYNLKNQPKRTTLLLLVTFATTFFVFLSCCNYIISTKYLPSSAFPLQNSIFNNVYEERIVIVKKDKSSFNNDEIEEIKSLDFVNNINLYDPTIDIYTNMMVGIEYSYGGYVNDINAIQEKDLSYGRLPNNDNEIVISGLFEKEEINGLLNKNCKIDVSGMYEKTFKIVGLIISDDLMSMDTKFYLTSPNIKDIYIFSRVYYDNSELIFQNKEIDTYFDLKYIDYIDDFEGSKLLFQGPCDPEKITINGKNIDYDYQFSDKYSISCGFDFYSLYIDSSVKQITLNVNNPKYMAKNIIYLNSMNYYATAPYLNSVDYGALLGFVLGIFSFISCGVNILIEYLISYLVIKRILIAKKKDYTILRTIGIDTKTIKNMSKVEMFITFTIAFIFVLVIFLILKNVDIQYLSKMLKVVSYFDLIIIYLVNIALSLLISKKFNELLMKKSLLGNLRVE